MAKDKLSLNQIRFVTEYVKDGNAKRAAIAAGYSERSAKQIGHDLLTENPDIVTLIEELRSKLVEDAGYDLKAAVKEIDSDLKLARENKNMMAVSKMLELKAKLHDLLTIKIKFEPVDISAALKAAEGRLLPFNYLEATYKDDSEDEEDKNV